MYLYDYIKFSIKELILKFKFTRKLWTLYKSSKKNNEYILRRKFYNNKFRKIVKNKISDKEFHHQLLDKKLIINKKNIGNLKSFVIVSGQSWHMELIPDLNEFGEITIFDYVAEGYTYQELKKFPLKRLEMNKKIIDKFCISNNERMVDWIFVYATGNEIFPNLIDELKKISNIPIVSMCLDDKHSWKSDWLGSYYSGQFSFAAKYDLAWTSSKVARKWYLSEGGNPIYLPEGFDKNSFFKVKNIKKDIPISFLGAPYGFRQDFIDSLKKNKIYVQTSGKGWKHQNDYGKNTNHLEIINQSIINLGHGGIGYSEKLKNLKKRDFDIPGSGNMYLTTYSSEIAELFQIGKEIICYSNYEDLTEIIRYYSNKPEECERIGYAGQERALNEHRWYHRYKKILTTLNII
tara:strand:+ start:2882 stop:4096 length:1215 start_codon:yes stop_codon:yes gene_type:complete